jgi:hypothetical protein
MAMNDDKTAEQLRASAGATNLHEAMRIVAQACCNSDMAWGAWLILLKNLEVRNVTVSDKDIDVAIDAATKADNFQGFSGYRRSAMRAALDSFASSILKHEVSDDEIDQAVEAFDNVYDGVSHNKRDAIREVLKTVNTRADSGEAVAWLVTDGSLFVDKAFTTKAHAERSVSERKDGVHIEPLFANPRATSVDVLNSARYNYLLDCEVEAALVYLPNLDVEKFKDARRAKHDAAIASREGG